VDAIPRDKVHQIGANTSSERQQDVKPNGTKDSTAGCRRSSIGIDYGPESGILLSGLLPAMARNVAQAHPACFCQSPRIQR